MQQKKKQRGLFDTQNHIDKVSNYTTPISRLAEIFNFEYFRPELDGFFERDKDRSKGGRPPYDTILMFKILILQSLYNISDDQMEFCINDHISFMQFLGLQMGDRIPDAKTIWLFRNELAKGHLIEELFTKLNRQLHKEGIIVNKGTLVDASFVNVPRQRNNREENEHIKTTGTAPSERKDDKKSQKDVDARWTKKNHETHYGYKDHVKADQETKLITGYMVTDAAVHDSQALDDLLTNNDKVVYADSAYRSQDQEDRLEAKRIQSQIHEKGARNHPLSDG